MKIKLFLTIIPIFSLQALEGEKRKGFLNNSLICKSLDYIEEPANRSAAINSVARLQRHIEGQMSTRVWASFVDGKEDLRPIFDNKHAAQKLGLVPSNVEAIQELIEKYRMANPNTGNIKVLKFAYPIMPRFIASRYEDRTTDLVDAYVEQRYTSNDMNNPLDDILSRESDLIDKDDILIDPNIRKGLALAVFQEYHKARYGHTIHWHILKSINCNNDDENSTKKVAVLLTPKDIESFNDVINSASMSVAYLDDIRPRAEESDDINYALSSLQYVIIRHKSFKNSLEDRQFIDSLLNSNSSLKFMYVYDDLQEEMKVPRARDWTTVIPEVIYVGKGVSKIENDFFGLNKYTSKITFYGYDNLEEIRDWFLRESESLEDVDLRSFNKVKKLGDSFLGRSKNLKKFSTDGLQKVEEVGKFFLSESESLEEVDLSGLKNVKKIGNSFLGESKNLKKVSTVGLENVEEVGDFFLYGCESLEEVDLSGLKKVEKIGSCFLQGCNKLNRIVMTKEVYDVLRVNNKDFLRLHSDKIIVNGQLENNASCSCVIQ